MPEFSGTVEAEGSLRLDRYLSEVAGLLSRSQLKSRVEAAFVNGKVVKLSKPVAAGDRFLVRVKEEEGGATVAQELPLVVLYEDDEVVVVDKAQGMVTHPAHGNWSGTLANGLLWRMRARGAAAVGESGAAGDPSQGTAPARAGIVHRLDKDTSGLIIAAGTAAAQDFLAAQFRDRSARKLYLAITQGRPREDRGRVDGWLARDPRDRKRFAPSAEGVGKRAVSDWKVLGSAGGYALLALSPKTGRTHQLRVHCKQLGCPILGDPIYGRKDSRFLRASLMLHAWRLAIRLPGREEPSRFEAPLPERFKTILDALCLSGPEGA